MKSSQEIIVFYARKHLGKLYKYGAKHYKAPQCFDCSSFTQYLYRRVKIDLPRRALEQIDYGKPVGKNQLKPGDLVFRKGLEGHYNEKHPDGIGHVGVYIGDGKVIHAKWKKQIAGKDIGKVIEENVRVFTEDKGFRGARRIIK
jgi:cell wall-associated NlpC family hydrolase